jgi:hypothetical protein
MNYVVYVQLAIRQRVVQALTNDSPGGFTDQDPETDIFKTRTPFGLHFGHVVSTAVFVLSLIFIVFLLF